MTKTERIRIKLAIIAALASKDWNGVALILDEFGIHELNRDRWEGSIESFISACLREARDEVPMRWRRPIHVMTRRQLT